MSVSKRAILDYVAEHPGAGREAIRRHVAPGASAPTMWRALKRLIEEGSLKRSGKARATGYRLAGADFVRAHLETPYGRRKPVTHNGEFVDRYVPGKSFYLAEEERRRLREAGTPIPPPAAGTYARQILERLLVDLAWASSRMEGNTYDLLQTERLIRFGEEASGRDRKEAVMILNHKEAIQYVIENLADITVARRDVFNIHALLADGLLIDPAMTGRLRRSPAGIFYSSYRPLEDRYAIEEEFDILMIKAAEIVDPFEQSFFLLVHIPYLQAFDDINRRTARVASNIPLLKADLAPLSFVTVDDAAYIDGLIGIYEMNDVSLLKEVYIDAYIASAGNYRVLRAELADPDKAVLAYREFVRSTVRRSVKQWRGFRPDAVAALAIEAGIPEADHDHVVEYVGKQIRGLHEGNLIRYRLRPEDLAALEEG